MILSNQFLKIRTSLDTKKYHSDKLNVFASL